MRAAAFLETMTGDQTNLLGRFLSLMSTRGIRFCVIDGEAVNAYVEPLVSLDLDVAIAADQLSLVETVLQTAFKVERFPHSLNVSDPDSALRIQIQIDPRYANFVARATVGDVLGHEMPVAALEDVLQGKVWAAKMTRGGRASVRKISPTSRGFWNLVPSFALPFPSPFSDGSCSRANPSRVIPAPARPYQWARTRRLAHRLPP